MYIIAVFFVLSMNTTSLLFLFCVQQLSDRHHNFRLVVAGCFGNEFDYAVHN